MARIDRLQPVVNAFIGLDGDAAMDAARAADETLSNGGDVPPLHGVPMAHKDLLYRKGRISTCGSKLRRNVTADVTATALERLDAAGAIEVGTLNMAEFAASGTGHNEHFGDCRNPWNTDHIPGGSSSGSGAAVAARLVPGLVGLRHRRFGANSGGSVRYNRNQTDGRPRLPLWSHATVLDQRYTGADGQDGSRCGPHDERRRRL